MTPKIRVVDRISKIFKKNTTSCTVARILTQTALSSRSPVGYVLSGSHPHPPRLAWKPVSDIPKVKPHREFPKYKNLATSAQWYRRQRKFLREIWRIILKLTPLCPCAVLPSSTARQRSLPRALVQTPCRQPSKYTTHNPPPSPPPLHCFLLVTPFGDIDDGTHAAPGGPPATSSELQKQ